MKRINLKKFAIISLCIFLICTFMPAAAFAESRIAGQSAYAAGVTVEKSNTDADKAKAEADAAKANADKAKAEADKAKAAADEAKADADRANADADKAKVDIETAKSNSEKAKAQAGKALEDANAAEIAKENALQETKSLKILLDKAKADAENTKKPLDDSEKALAPLKEPYESAKAAAEKSRAAADEAKNKADAAVSERDAAFTSEKEKAGQLLEEAQKTFNAADLEYNAARSALDNLTTSLSDKKNNKSSLEQQAEKLRSDKTAVDRRISTLTTDVKNAEAAVTASDNKWKQDIAAAEAAEVAYNSAGRKFINKKIQDQNGYDLDAMIAESKTYTNAAITPITKNGKTYSTVADVANSENFEKIVDRACTYENLKKSIAYIKEANIHRGLPIHNAGNLKVSYQLMGTAIISNAVSVYQIGHNLLKGDTNWKFWKSGNSYTSGENLAFSGASKEHGWDPFHGWYYEERIKHEADLRGVEADQTLVDEILQESAANGFPYDPYSAPWYQSKSKFLNDVKNTVTGHYTSLINSKFKATGFSYIDAPEYALTGFPYVASQEFNGDTSASVSVDEYEQMLENWFASYKSALDNAVETRSALDAEPAELITAKAALEEKKSDLAASKSESESLSAQISAKESEITAVAAEITQLQNTDIPAAQKTKDDSETNRNACEDNLTKAEAANTKAQALDQSKPETFADYNDLKQLSETAAALIAASEDAESAALAAEAAYGETEEKYSAAKTEYDNAKQAYDTAAAEYAEAEQNHNNALNLYAQAKLAHDKAVELCDKTQQESEDALKAIEIAEQAYTKALQKKENAEQIAVETRKAFEKADMLYKEAKQDYEAAKKAYDDAISKGQEQGDNDREIKLENTLTVKGKTAKVKYSSLKKKAQNIKVSKAITVKKAKGKVTYKKVSVGSKKINKKYGKKFSINSKTGKITVKKGVKKGTYKMKIRVTASGNKTYKAKTKTVTCKIIIK